ncbi:MAG: hypothetical protein ACI936_003280 [Paraglaciecola sp.]|jgi:hypothetical protein
MSIMARDERWEGSNRAHVLTFEYFKQIHMDDLETILYKQGKLNTLKYWNPAAPSSSEENEMRAFDAAAMLIRFAFVRNIKFEDGMTKETAMAEFYEIMKDGDKAVFRLAEAVDKYYLFNNEVGFQ